MQILTLPHLRCFSRKGHLTPINSLGPTIKSNFSYWNKSGKGFAQAVVTGLGVGRCTGMVRAQQEAGKGPEKMSASGSILRVEVPEAVMGQMGGFVRSRGAAWRERSPGR